MGTAVKLTSELGNTECRITEICVLLLYCGGLKPAGN